MQKLQLLLHLMGARDEWERLINQVGSRRVSIGSVSGHWSVKDIISHIAARELHLADRLAEIARCEPVRVSTSYADLASFLDEFGYPDFDSPLLSESAADQWVFEKYRNVAVDEAIADELHAFECLLSAVHALTEQQLNDLGLVHKIRHVTLDHYRQHGADIRKRFKQPLRS